ncbi:MAG TPA: hypothetical protein VHK70_03675 [Burkholderiaceae bacterium]|nr:hypothetical protein [Burkholderiaceae bacterium]
MAEVTRTAPSYHHITLHSATDWNPPLFLPLVTFISLGLGLVLYRLVFQRVSATLGSPDQMEERISGCSAGSPCRTVLASARCAAGMRCAFSSHAVMR